LAAIAENLHYLPSIQQRNPDHYLNHSCDPNVWMIDEVTLAARRDIAKGEEVVADYAMWDESEHHMAPGPAAAGLHCVAAK
jgi:hypothetical protein